MNKTALKKHGSVFIALGMCPQVLSLTEKEIRIEVFPSIEGVLAPLGKEPVLFAGKVQALVFPDATMPGEVKVSASIDANHLLVIYPNLTDDERARLLKQMRERVLKTQAFSNIEFNSTEITTELENGQLCLVGNLEICGVTKTISILFHLTEDNRLEGETTLKQSDFAIIPLTAFGGTLRAKDKVKIRVVITAQDFLK